MNKLQWGRNGKMLSIIDTGSTCGDSINMTADKPKLQTKRYFNKIECCSQGEEHSEFSKRMSTVKINQWCSLQDLAYYPFC